MKGRSIRLWPYGDAMLKISAMGRVYDCETESLTIGWFLCGWRTFKYGRSWLVVIQQIEH